eukprot:TRINITY_DN1325_c0_g1_i1.p1 TRINITY_DN1325_c0_g1~~TRINITY_DN1325_c0_g1_i1.p1  ORF type:complete len:438 (+),score=33.26 TRINITY_DN1325_c0_g1_i1:51-1364(+)
MAYKISIESLYLLLLYNNKFKQMKPSFFFLLTLCTAFASDPIWEPPLDPLPNEEWESDSVDLGNGGDRTFYLLTKCKNCNIPPPLIMWLAGGPGGSSIPASYLEVGPYLFNTSYQLHKNPWAWTNHVDVMFVDNPVGVPFSIARDSTTLCRNETCVARNLYVLLSKFIHAHPEYRKRPFYLAGESYAGHYIPAFGKYLIKAKNPDINFVGAAVGNGMIDTYIQNPYIPDFLHKNHNISEVGYVLLKTAHLLCNSAKGIELFQRACDFIAIITAQWLKIPDPYDIKGDGKSDPVYLQRFIQFINSTHVKRLFGVENQSYATGSHKVAVAMYGDISFSLSENIGYCIENGKKFIFWFGADDMVCQWIGGLNTLLKLPWSGNEGFRQALEEEWRSREGQVLGSMKTYKELKFIKIYNAGHGIVMKQPQALYEMLFELLSY